MFGFGKKKDDVFHQYMNEHIVPFGTSKQDILNRFPNDDWHHSDDHFGRNKDFMGAGVSIRSSQQNGFIHLSTTYDFDIRNRIEKYNFFATGPGVNQNSYRRMITFISGKYQIGQDPLGFPNSCTFTGDIVDGSISFKHEHGGEGSLAIFFGRKSD